MPIDIEEQLRRRETLMKAMADLCEGEEIVTVSAALGEVVCALFEQARATFGHDKLYEDWLRMLTMTMRGESVNERPH